MDEASANIREIYLSRMPSILEATGLIRDFGSRRAVDGIDLVLRGGECLAVFGPNGAGKTTLLRLLAGLLKPTSGSVLFRGQDVLRFSRRRLREARRHMQIVFQDPYSSLNPRMRARHIVEEPLIIHRLGDRRSRAARVARWTSEAASPSATAPAVR